MSAARHRSCTCGRWRSRSSSTSCSRSCASRPGASIVRHPVRAAVVALLGAVGVDGVDGGARVTDRRSVARVPRHRFARDGSARRAWRSVCSRVRAGRGRRWRAVCDRARVLARGAVVIGGRVAHRHPGRDARRSTVTPTRCTAVAFSCSSLVCGVIVVVVVTLPGAEIAKMLARAVAGRRRTALVLALPLALAGARVHHRRAPVSTARRCSSSGCVVSVVLAEISYRLIERPFRVGAVAKRSGSRGAVAVLRRRSPSSSVLLVVTVAAPVALPAERPGRRPPRQADCETRPLPPVRCGSISSVTPPGWCSGSAGRCTPRARRHRWRRRPLGMRCGARRPLQRRPRGRRSPRSATDGRRVGRRRCATTRTRSLALMTGAWDILDQRDEPRSSSGSARRRGRTS